MSDVTYHGLPIARFSLTIGGKTFATGDHVTTPDGDGMAISADPFADAEILVRLSGGMFAWYSFRDVEVIAQERDGAAEGAAKSVTDP